MEETFELSTQQPLSDSNPHNPLHRRTTLFGRSKTLNQAPWKSEFLSALWGFDRNADVTRARWLNKIERLEPYFRDCQGFLPRPNIEDCDRASSCEGSTRMGPFHRRISSLARYPLGEEGVEHSAHVRLLRYIQLLKLNPEIARTELKRGILGGPHRNEIGQPVHHLQTRGSSGTSEVIWPAGTEPSDFLVSPLNQKESVELFNMSLAAATRALFGISIHDEPCFSPGERQIKQSKCLWKEDMNIKDLLNREFPTGHPGDHLSGRFKERLISLRNLVRHADIDIVWTKHLPDHLLLSYGEANKTLSIFDLPSLIEISYEACERVGEGEPNIDKLTYCHDNLGGLMFSAEFMLETLQTYRLLVPHRDFKWARRTFLSSVPGSGTQRLTPWKKAHQQASDPRLTEIFSFWHHDADVGTRLTTYSQMFKRYPHWGLRIQSLMEEAEDPTPMTWIGRWAERRKGPRHAFWVTVVAFVVASLFGTIAMALGIVQFWVAWCDWNGTKAKMCNPRGETTTTSLPSDVVKLL